MRAAAATIAAVLAAGPAPHAGAARQDRIPVTALGPQVGERTPRFRLPDQHVRPTTLSQVAGPRGTMLVFIRSADW